MSTDAPSAAEAPQNEPDPAAQRSRLSAFLPQSTVQMVIGVAALMFLAAAVGFVVGTRDATPNNPSRGSTDVGFLYDMTAHHEQAVVLAAIELINGEHPDAQRFAREILRSQAYEIGLMEMRLGTFGHDPADRPDAAMEWMGMSVTHPTMPGMAGPDELDAFRQAQGPEADALFLALMIDHHLGGVAMARHAAENAEHEWVAQTAATMASIQAGEISQMVAARDQAGMPAAPPGFTADFEGGADAMAPMGDEHEHD